MEGLPLSSGIEISSKKLLDPVVESFDILLHRSYYQVMGSLLSIKFSLMSSRLISQFSPVVGSLILKTLLNSFNFILLLIIFLLQFLIMLLQHFVRVLLLAF